MWDGRFLKFSALISFFWLYSLVQDPPALETPVFYTDKEPDSKDLDWEEGDQGTMSFDDAF